MENDREISRKIVLLGPLKPVVVRGLEAACTVHKAAEAKDTDAFFAAHSGVGAIACSATTEDNSRQLPWRASRSCKS